MTATSVELGTCQLFLHFPQDSCHCRVINPATRWEKLYLTYEDFLDNWTPQV